MMTLCYANPNSLYPPLIRIPPKSPLPSPISHNFVGYNSLLPRNFKFYSIRASDSTSTAATDEDDGASSVRWLLQPIGDGDWKHIGYKIAMPGAFEIASSAVTVGRVPEKANVVISVPTVSGLHARIQKTRESLLITDLDSTNGTFINEKRLIPGIRSPASPGNLITFGDTNLAIFKVYKVEEEVGFDSDPENEAKINTEATA